MGWPSADMVTQGQGQSLFCGFLTEMRNGPAAQEHRAVVKPASRGRVAVSEGVPRVGHGLAFFEE